MRKTKENTFVQKNFRATLLDEEVFKILPSNMREIFQKLPSNMVKPLEEIRLRVGQPLMIGIGNKDYMIKADGSITDDEKKSYQLTLSDIQKAYQLITDYSIYALQEEIKNGFITLKGGHRVGICGTMVMDHDKVKTIKNISGLNIRISKEKIGVSNKIMTYLLKDKQFLNTLIVSPPQCGKTTLLRDIIRNISNGMDDLNFNGFKVGVVDERSEIGGTYQGIAQNHIGIRTDILNACPKATGMMLLIRSMSPQIIATDEIGKIEDVMAMYEAIHAGIQLITTVHGKSLEEIKKRKYLKTLIKDKVFDRMIILSNQPKVGTIKAIVDGKTFENVYDLSTGGRSNFAC